MTKEQKIAGGILSVIVLLLILSSINGGEDIEKSAQTATTTEELKATKIVLPETNGQEIVIEGGQGTYVVSPTSSRLGKVSVSNEPLEQGNDVVSVVYQDPGGASTYAWLVLFTKEGETLKQNSNLFLGENVFVNKLSTVEGQNGSYAVLVEMTSKVSIDGHTTNQNTSLSVQVRQSKFDQLSVKLLR